MVQIRRRVKRRRVKKVIKMEMKKVAWKGLTRLVKAAERSCLRGKGEPALKGTTRGNRQKMQGQLFIFFGTIKGMKLPTHSKHGFSE